MQRTLHTLSAFFFYLLGLSFFVAAVFLKRGFFATDAAWWLQVADLPLLLSGLVYAGVSLYESMRGSKGHSPSLAVGIAVPFVAFFTVLLALNFWPK